MSPARKRLASFLAVALLGAGFVVRQALRADDAQIRFDASQWSFHEFTDPEHWKAPCARQRMVKDLVTNHLPGKTRSQVVQLLGPSGKLCDRELAHGWQLVYDIGIEQIVIWDHRNLAFSPDHEELLVSFGSDDKFRSWTIIGAHSWKTTVGWPGLRNYQKPPRDGSQNMGQS